MSTDTVTVTVTITYPDGKEETHSSLWSKSLDFDDPAVWRLLAELHRREHLAAEGTL